MFSKTFQYGLKASVLLALRPEGEYVKVREMSEQLHIPKSVLAKTLQVLGSAGVIDTLRGPSGGCRWNRASDALTLVELARILEGDFQFQGCLLGLADCGPDENCILPEFSPARLQTAMQAVSLRDVAEQCRGRSDYKQTKDS